MAISFFIIYLAFSLIVVANNLNRRIWEVGTVLYLLVATFLIGFSWIAGIIIWVLLGIIFAVERLPSVRNWISDRIYSKAKNAMPSLSKTEEEALNAGDTWLEEDIFRGKPDWDRLAGVKTELTEEEQSFLDNETQELCDMLDEWQISQEKDLSPKVWDFLKQKGFLGLVIKKEFGGKGFSARAHSDVVLKVASRSGVAAVTVMVPNSLGPGELLHFYGTKKQKEYYLPRLACGEEIPCFALTEPGAGSDATSIQSEAIVAYGELDGKKTLGLHLTLDKRWITLSPVATLIGLAVHLRDPDELLQGVGEEGITCLLISRDTKNLEIGNRHLPADQPFMNGTIRGKDIFVPIDTIIGGQEKAGHGWQMLVECLSIGRSISLPALAAASSSISYLTSGAFSKIRQQFGVEIGQFEGVEEKLAEIAGLTYLINSTRMLTLAAVQEHKKPSVASAITKYFNTELARVVINNAMDVHAGRTVVVGPRNYLINFYLGLPISITVEGANIMSRNLLIFGQGSMACHPFLREEFYAVSKGDKKEFRVLIWQHVHYLLQNFSKMVCAAWTAGYFIRAPKSKLKREYRKLARLSYAFATFADVALMILGGDLKRKERLSARLADALSYLYMAQGVLRQAQLQGETDAHLVHANWALQYCFNNAQSAMVGLCRNFPIRIIGFLLRVLAFPRAQSMAYPSDKLEHKLAQTMRDNNDCRDQLSKFVYLSGDSKQPVDKMEQALQALLKHRDVYKKVGNLKRVLRADLENFLQKKVDDDAITTAEKDIIIAVEHQRWDAELVDEFSASSMQHKTFSSLTDKIYSQFSAS